MNNDMPEVIYATNYADNTEGGVWRPTQPIGFEKYYHANSLRDALIDGMLELGLATGHGDTFDDVFNEFMGQVRSLIAEKSK